MTMTNRRKEVLFLEEGQAHASPIPVAVKAGGFIFLSAIRGVNPKTNVVDSDDPEEQARIVFDVIKSTLTALGATMQHVVKVACFVTDIQERTVFNKLWQENFPVDPPARFAVEVPDLGVPGDKTKFLVDVIALAP